MPTCTFTPAAAAGPANRASNQSLRRVTADSMIDVELVQRFLNHDERAFVEIMNRYRQEIFASANRLLHNHADAEEITQDTFIRAHRGLVNFRGDSSLSTWLHRIAVNLSRNRYWFYFRRHRQDSLSLDCELSSDNTGTFSELVADTGQDPAQEVVTQEFSTLVERCMTGLEAGHREILTLRNALNHSYSEIAVLLGLRVGTVKSRIARARFKLRVLLAEACPEFAADATPGAWFLPSRAVYGRPVIACA